MEELLAKLRDYVALYGLRALGALAIFLVGWIVAKLARRIVRRLMEKSKAAPILVSSGSQMTYILLMIFVIFAALSQLGVKLTSAIALLGAAGLAVGLALTGSLANLAGAYCWSSSDRLGWVTSSRRQGRPERWKTS